MKKSILTLSVLGGLGVFVQGAVAQEYCREYTENITINGAPHTAYGTACRQPDGAWKKHPHKKPRRAAHAPPSPSHGHARGYRPAVRVLHQYPGHGYGYRYTTPRHYYAHPSAYTSMRYGVHHGSLYLGHRGHH